MKQSGGHVKIYSESGEGTTIELYLPRREGNELVISGDDDLNSERGGGETILIVEDDDGVRQYASEILRDLNYQIIEAKNSATALRLLDADKKSTCCLRMWFFPVRTVVSSPTRLNDVGRGRKLFS